MINIIINIVIIISISIFSLKYTNEKLGLFVLKNPWFYKIKYISNSNVLSEFEKNDIIQHLQVLSNELLNMKKKLRYIILLLCLILVIDPLFDIYIYYIHDSFVINMHHYIYNVSMPIFIFLFFYMLMIENKFTKRQYIIWNKYISKWNSEHNEINIQQ